VIRRIALLSCAALIAAACTPPIRARHVDARKDRRVVASNALTTGKISRRTGNLLYEQDLVERYDDDPAEALAALHATFVAGRLQHEDMASLAELAFHYGEHGGGRPYYLASALYAWAYLFPDDASLTPETFDPRGRVAYELYNRGLTEGFKSGDNVDVRAGSYPLPFGTLDVYLDPSELTWSGHQLTSFFPLAELEVKGFPTYHRWAGLGAPLAAGIAPGGRDQDILAPRARVPVTVILRPSDLSRALREARVQATLELYPGYGEETVTVGKRRVPLEAEPTAAMALALTETNIYSRELTGFLRGSGVIAKKAQLVSTRPYRP